MGIHALTRVTCNGSVVTVVAGPIPPHIAVQGLTEKVEAVPVDTPLTQVKHIAKEPVKPARFEVPPRTVKPQAEVKESKANGS